MAYEVNCRSVVIFNATVLCFFGVIPPKFEKNNSAAKILHFLRVYLMGFLCGSLIICQMVYLYITFGGPIRDIVTATYLTLTNLLSGIKLYRVYQTRGRIMLLLEAVNNPVFQPKSRYQTNVLESYIRWSKAITIVMMALSHMVIFLMTIYPFTAEGDLFLPLPAHIPYNTDTSPTFEITYAYEVVGILLGAWAGNNADGLIIGFILFLCAQLTLLNDSLEHLREHTSDDLGLRSIDRNEEAFRKLVDEKMEERLVDCIHHQRNILVFKDEISSIFGNLSLAQFIISVLTLCTSLFELTTVSEMNLQFFSLVFCMMFLLTEIYCMCYFGNEIISKSSRLTSSAYQSDWLDCSKEFKKNLIIFMIRSQIDMKYLAGNLFKLSLETFVKIVKSSVSYFTVLHQLSDQME